MPPAWVICFGIPIALLPATLIALWAYNSANKRRGGQAALIERHRQSYPEGDWLPVRYASEYRFSRFWKFIPWEQNGVLYVGPERLAYVKTTPSGSDVVAEYALADIDVHWKGWNLPSDVLSWFEVQHKGEKHYFTSETGTWVFGSKNSSLRIFHCIMKRIRGERC